MIRRLPLLFLALALTATSFFVPKSAKAGDVYVALKITYYSDASHTVQVGECHYTNCHQFVLGNWTCTGTTSSYGVPSNYLYCPPPV
jgi:hypothetical protein